MDLALHASFTASCRRPMPWKPAIDRIMQTYALLMNSSAGATESARIKVTDCVSMLSKPAKKYPHRLAVSGPPNLRELDGSTYPVKVGFTGL
jgi:hypothetical protein